MKKRNKFSLSNYKIFSANMGYLLPIGLYEVLPGDTIQQSTSLFLRMAPMVSPVMHPVHATIHHWYVPLRLLWTDFENFITGGPDGLDVSIPPFVNIQNSDESVGSLSDYLGVPPTSSVSPNDRISALPFRAYNLIYNEWYRDQDLETPRGLLLTGGLDPGTVGGTDLTLARSCWEKDYFTTARPWPQKGPDVTVPVNAASGGFSITGTGAPTFNTQSTGGSHGTSNLFGTAPDGIVGTLIPANIGGNTVSEVFSSDGTWADPHLSVSGDISLGSIGINALREAFALQRFEEHRAMYGSRYTEYLRYLGVRASDARLQRPEYLGGSKQTIQFSEVLQTAEGESPVGQMRGHGIAAMRSNRFLRFIEEHGFVISLLQVMPKAIYPDGLDRLWSRRVKEDYWQKELEHIGQQEVLTKEVFFTGDETSDDVVFGYQNRYDEYRRVNNSISGEFRDILNYWHMARDFSEAPVLNESFISGAPTDRIFASQTTDQMYCMASHSIQARRFLSRQGNPI